MLEVSLLGVGTVLRLERDSWSIIVKLRRQATYEYTLPPHAVIGLEHIVRGVENLTSARQGE